MKNAVGNMLDVDCDALVITTNGFVKANGEAVMGRGIAKQIADALPFFPGALGALLKRHGNCCHYVTDHNDVALVTMPVKHRAVMNDRTNVVEHAMYKFGYGDFVPGFYAKADLELIKCSAAQLASLADIHEWQTIAIPRAGCGAGELEWEDVEPVLQEYLDDRFTAYTYE